MEKEILGKCPVCNTGDIVAEDSLFKCSEAEDSYNEETEEWEHKGCQYKIFRGALSKLGKSEITNDEVRKLLSDKSVIVKINNREKTAMNDVNMVIDEKWGVQVEFEKSTPKEAKDVGLCPLCKKDQVKMYDKLYKCSGGISEKNADGTWNNSGCQYKVFRSAFQKFGKQDITEVEIRKLLSDGKVEVTILSKKDGSPQQVEAVYDAKWGIQLNFSK